MDAIETKPEIRETSEIRGAMVIFYKETEDGRYYLVVENAETGNVTFVGGGEEDVDGGSLQQVAQREISEELGLSPDKYELKETEITHTFEFNESKPERTGKQGKYKVFLAKIIGNEEVGYTPELQNARWMREEGVQSALTFPDVKQIFDQAKQKI